MAWGSNPQPDPTIQTTGNKSSEYLLSGGRESSAAGWDLKGADIVAVTGADVEQLEDAPSHKHLEQEVKKMSKCVIPQIQILHR